MKVINSLMLCRKRREGIKDILTSKLNHSNQDFTVSKIKTSHVPKISSIFQQNPSGITVPKNTKKDLETEMNPHKLGIQANSKKVFATYSRIHFRMETDFQAS